AAAARWRTGMADRSMRRYWQSPRATTHSCPPSAPPVWTTPTSSPIALRVGKKSAASLFRRLVIFGGTWDRIRGQDRPRRAPVGEGRQSYMEPPRRAGASPHGESQSFIRDIAIVDLVVTGQRRRKQG